MSSCTLPSKFFPKDTARHYDAAGYAADVAKHLRGKVFGFDPTVRKDITPKQRAQMRAALTWDERGDLDLVIGTDKYSKSCTFVEVIQCLMKDRGNSYYLTPKEFKKLEKLARGFVAQDQVTIESLKASHLLPDHFENAKMGTAHKFFYRKFGRFDKQARKDRSFIKQKGAKATYGAVLQVLAAPDTQVLSEQVVRRMHKAYGRSHLAPALSVEDEKSVRELLPGSDSVLITAGPALDEKGPVVFASHTVDTYCETYRSAFTARTDLPKDVWASVKASRIHSGRERDFAIAMTQVRKEERGVGHKVTEQTLRAAFGHLDMTEALRRQYEHELLGSKDNVRLDTIEDLTDIAHVAMFKEWVDPVKGPFANAVNFKRFYPHTEMTVEAVRALIAKNCVRSDEILAPGAKQNETIAFMMASALVEENAATVVLHV